MEVHGMTVEVARMELEELVKDCAYWGERMTKYMQMPETAMSVRVCNACYRKWNEANDKARAIEAVGVEAYAKNMTVVESILHDMVEHGLQDMGEWEGL
jgi:hypothetical protein